MPMARSIRGIVFDLDGTLYVSDSFSATIKDAAVAYIAGLRSLDTGEACQLLNTTRSRMARQAGTAQTLSAVCVELGGTVRDLHACFQAQLHPEAHLIKDQRVITLLENLGRNFELHLFTNNNRALTTRIVDFLGLGGLFQTVYTIDDTWKGKPDLELLERVLAEIRLTPEEAIFVGDRYDVDLRLPEQIGCPVYLSQSIEQLLRLEDVLQK